MSDRAPSALIDPAELATCLRVLDALRASSVDDPARVAVERASSHLQKSAKKKRRAARHVERRAREQALDGLTGRVQLQEDHRTLERDRTPEGSVGELPGERVCYVCKARYRAVDAFYHLLMS